MPVRKIPKNYLVVTGAYSSQKNEEMDAFESLLEREYLLLLDFDDAVERFEVQPVRIPVPGVPKGYVPDVLVIYRSDPETGCTRKPLLVDVKHSDDLKRNAGKYMAKFVAAQRFSEDRGWEFATVDETQIRTPRLANLKFLREYRNVMPSDEHIQRVLECVNGQTSSTALLDALARTEDDRLHWFPVVWSMVLTGHLAVDLDRPFTDDVPLWRVEGES